MKLKLVTPNRIDKTFTFNVFLREITCDESSIKMSDDLK